jgi:ABC-type branched-subunit amino acid transport system substrate-binding protein
MKRVAAAFFLLLAWSVVGCGSDDDSAAPVASSSCAEVLYEGEGEPDLIVVSDLPRRGPSAEAAQPLIDAIELVLRQRDFRAGEYRVGYQSCTGIQGVPPFVDDELLCKRNARDYVATEDVVGIIGPWHSGCAELQIPIVTRKAAGPLAMISPVNTDVVLTRASPGADLYPDGVRSYTRVVAHDSAQGAAAAHLAERAGARRVAVLQEKEVDPRYARGLTVPFVASARSLGLEVVRFEWPVRKSYTGLAASVAAARPGAVFLAGVTDANAKRLVEDLRAALGPEVTFIGPDSFAGDDIAAEFGTPGEGIRVTSPSIPPEKLPPAGQRFLHELAPAKPPYAVAEAAQATHVLLDAIARSDGTRASVVEELFRTKVTDGILGSFSLDRYGDIAPAPVGIYRYEGGKLVVEDVIRAPLGEAR